MEYSRVNASQIEEMIQEGKLQKLSVIKDIPVKAVQLTQNVVDNLLSKGGYETVVIDDNGKTFVETTNKKLNVGDFLVTNQISGYDNSYVVPQEKFAKLYEATEKSNVFNAVAVEKTVFLIPAGLNLVFEAPWGGDMKIRAEGVLVPDGDKFYGINPEEFKATHSINSNDKNNVLNAITALRIDSTEKKIKLDI